MSDLKDLAWSAQTAAAAPDFETIVRRAHRRRTRRQAITAAATATAVVVVAAVTATAPFRDRSGDPATTVPPPSQTSSLPPTALNAEKIVTAPGAKLQDIAMTDDGHWLAAWRSCNADESSCLQATAAGYRDEDQPGFDAPRQDTLMVAAGDPAVAYAIPLTGSLGDPAEPEHGIAVTMHGGSRSIGDLLPAAAARTFGADEIVVSGEDAPYVLGKSRTARTYRKLVVPGGDTHKYFTVARSGRKVWVLTESVNDGRPLLMSTSDGGATWSPRTLDGRSTMGLAVSPDGQTVVTVTGTQSGTDRPAAVVRVSRDAGRSWATVIAAPWATAGMPVAADDGSVYLLGHGQGEQGQAAYRIGADNIARTDARFPARLEWIGGAAKALYGKSGNTVQLSTDGGKTWRAFEPR